MGWSSWWKVHRAWLRKGETGGKYWQVGGRYIGQSGGSIIAPMEAGGGGGVTVKGEARDMKG